MRELKYLIATTADGFIARSDGSFDFFPADGDYIAELVKAFPDTIPGHMRKALGVHGANTAFDAVLMGRGTYEVGLKIGVTNPYPHLEQYVVSRTIGASPDANVHIVSSDPVAFVQNLKQRDGKDIWLCGGGSLATALFAEIDELILKLNPIVLGSGIPLFAGAPEPTALRLIDSRIYGNGVTLLRYRVAH